MHTAQPNASPTIPPGMLQTIAAAICDRPDDTPAQRAARSRVVMGTVQGFEPRDPVQVMLAGMAVTHAHLLEDAARDVCRCQDDRLKARTRSQIVALGRGMFGFLKELRAIQTQRAAAVAITGTAADAIVNDVPVGALKRAAPQTPSVAADPLARSRAPEQPVPWSPPLRRAETSVAAMSAVTSPPTPPYKAVAGATVARHARPSEAEVATGGPQAPVARHARSSAAEVVAGGPQALAA